MTPKQKKPTTKNKQTKQKTKSPQNPTKKPPNQPARKAVDQHKHIYFKKLLIDKDAFI